MRVCVCVWSSPFSLPCPIHCPRRLIRSFALFLTRLLQVFFMRTSFFAFVFKSSFGLKISFLFEKWFLPLRFHMTSFGFDRLLFEVSIFRFRFQVIRVLYTVFIWRNAACKQLAPPLQHCFRINLIYRVN